MNATTRQYYHACQGESVQDLLRFYDSIKNDPGLAPTFDQAALDGISRYVAEATSQHGPCPGCHDTGTRNSTLHDGIPCRTCEIRRAS